MQGRHKNNNNNNNNNNGPKRPHMSPLSREFQPSVSHSPFEPKAYQFSHENESSFHSPTFTTQPQHQQRNEKPNTNAILPLLSSLASVPSISTKLDLLQELRQSIENPQNAHFVITNMDKILSSLDLSSRSSRSPDFSFEMARLLGTFGKVISHDMCFLRFSQWLFKLCNTNQNQTRQKRRPLIYELTILKIALNGDLPSQILKSILPTVTQILGYVLTTEEIEIIVPLATKICKKEHLCANPSINEIWFAYFLGWYQDVQLSPEIDAMLEECLRSPRLFCKLPGHVFQNWSQSILTLTRDLFNNFIAQHPHRSDFLLLLKLLKAFGCVIGITPHTAMTNHTEIENWLKMFPEYMATVKDKEWLAHSLESLTLVVQRLGAVFSRFFSLLLPFLLQSLSPVHPTILTKAALNVLLDIVKESRDSIDGGEIIQLASVVEEYLTSPSEVIQQLTFQIYQKFLLHEQAQYTLATQLLKAFEKARPLLKTQELRALQIKMLLLFTAPDSVLKSSNLEVLNPVRPVISTHRVLLFYATKLFLRKKPSDLSVLRTGLQSSFEEIKAMLVEYLLVQQTVVMQDLHLTCSLFQTYKSTISNQEHQNTAKENTPQSKVQDKPDLTLQQQTEFRHQNNQRDCSKDENDSTNAKTQTAETSHEETEALDSLNVLTIRHWIQTVQHHLVPLLVQSTNLELRRKTAHLIGLLNQMSGRSTKRTMSLFNYCLQHWGLWKGDATETLHMFTPQAGDAPIGARPSFAIGDFLCSDSLSSPLDFSSILFYSLLGEHQTALHAHTPDEWNELAEQLSRLVVHSGQALTYYAAAAVPLTALQSHDQNLSSQPRGTPTALRSPVPLPALLQWVVRECSKYCVTNKLKTHFGPPAATFQQIEKLVLTALTTAHSEDWSITRALLILDFIGTLERDIAKSCNNATNTSSSGLSTGNIINTGNAVISGPCTPRATRIFFCGNQRVVDDLFFRLRQPLVWLSTICGRYATGWVHASQRVLDLRRLISGGTGLKESPGRVLSDLESAMLGVAAPLAARGQADSMNGLILWAKNYLRQTLTRSKLFDDALRVDYCFLWLKGLYFKSRGQFELAAQAFQDILIKPDIKWTLLDPATIEFVIRETLHCLEALGDLESIGPFRTQITALAVQHRVHVLADDFDYLEALRDFNLDHWDQAAGRLLPEHSRAQSQSSPVLPNIAAVTGSDAKPPKSFLFPNPDTPAIKLRAVQRNLLLSLLHPNLRSTFQKNTTGNTLNINNNHGNDQNVNDNDDSNNSEKDQKMFFGEEIFGEKYWKAARNALQQAWHATAVAQPAAREPLVRSVLFAMHAVELGRPWGLGGWSATRENDKKQSCNDDEVQIFAQRVRSVATAFSEDLAQLQQVAVIVKAKMKTLHLHINRKKNGVPLAANPEDLAANPEESGLEETYQWLQQLLAVRARKTRNFTMATRLQDALSPHQRAKLLQATGATTEALKLLQEISKFEEKDRGIGSSAFGISKEAALMMLKIVGPATAPTDLLPSFQLQGPQAANVAKTLARWSNNDERLQRAAFVQWGHQEPGRAWFAFGNWLFAQGDAHVEQFAPTAEMQTSIVELLHELRVPLGGGQETAEAVTTLLTLLVTPAHAETKVDLVKEWLQKQQLQRQTSQGESETAAAAPSGPPSAGAVEQLLRFGRTLEAHEHGPTFGAAIHAFFLSLRHAATCHYSDHAKNNRHTDSTNDKTSYSSTSISALTTARLLRLLMYFHTVFAGTLEQQLATAPSFAAWSNVLPQVFARLNVAAKSGPLLSRLLGQIVLGVATERPDEVVLAALTHRQIFAHNSNNFIAVDSNNNTSHSGSASGAAGPTGSLSPHDEVDEALAHLKRTEPLLVQEASLFLSEMLSITIMWAEQWVLALHRSFLEIHARVEAFRRAVPPQAALSSETYQNALVEFYMATKPVQNSLASLYTQTCEAVPASPSEEEFQKTWKVKLQAFVQHIQSKDFINPTTHWLPLKEIALELTRSFSKNRLILKDLSPILSEKRFQRLKMPGLCENENVVLQGFGQTISVLPTKTRPKKIKFLGSNGMSYQYLLKGGEDLRLDERIQQLLIHVNYLLKTNKETRSRRLRARTYAIVPLSSEAGIIQWVENALPLFTLYKNVQRQESEVKQMLSKEPEKDPNYFPFKLSEIFYPRLFKLMKDQGYTGKEFPHQIRRNCSPEMLKRVYLDLASESPKNLISKEIWNNSESSLDTMDRTRQFAYSVATMSVIGYVIGLGDRHLDNILLDSQTSEIIHIDYNICFDKGRKLRVPETVPFRLTQNIYNAMGLTGIEGNFLIGCETVMQVLKHNKDILLSLLESFEYHPLLEWTTRTTVQPLQPLKKEGEPEDFEEQDDDDDSNSVVEDQEMKSNLEAALDASKNPQALSVLKTIRRRLTEPASISSLVQQAMSIDNLSQMYEGWFAWI